MSRLTVLIAEDNDEWCKLIARILEPEYSVIGFVAQGSEVVREAVARQPNIITLDVSMPGMSGLRLLPELRAAMPKLAIVMLSTESRKLYVDEAHRRGADAYVAKRRTASDLIPAIEDAVRHDC